MRRAFLLAVLGAAGLVALPAGPVAAERPQSTVRLVSCSVAEHAAAFHGRMRRIPGTRRMWMRFTLLERTGSDGFRPVKAAGLGKWRRSKVGVGTFGYRQVVVGLPAGAAHRMRVDFRWYAQGRELLQEIQKRSPVCRQYEALPNLQVRITGSSPTKARGVSRYFVRVGNAGKAPATGVPVRLSVDGDVIDTQTVSLLAGQRRTIGFRGPDCNTTVTAEADPDGLLVESSEDDNAGELACADTVGG